MGRTVEQLDAINRDGTNIIVSAGAGSGKTTVLTDRVIRKLKEGVHINELLILTFTNAAAAEMKERIRKAIIKEDLEQELEFLDSAYITTFDSYALSTLKKYHYMLNISSEISIIDSSLISLKKNEFLDFIFEELYKNENCDFEKLIGDFCIKDDKNIKKAILNISSKLDLKVNKQEYLNTYLEKYYSEEYLDSITEIYTNFLRSKIQNINLLLEQFKYYTTNEFYNEISESLNSLLNNSENYEEIKLNANLVKLPRLSKAEDIEKKYKKMITDEINSLKKLVTFNSSVDIKENIKMTKDYVRIIISIINELDEMLFQYKFSNDLYEFNDIANLSIKLLKENKDIRDEIKYSLNEIMIDEYQDTNDTQEEFISYISNNNVYMVGDIKQSIYRFRNANPYIFKEKYDSYSNNIGGYKIDLNKNFRSREETLNNINIIFNLIMDDIIGGANYKFDHQMIFGNTNYNESGKTSQNDNFEIYDYIYDKESGFTKEEYEIFIIANDIKRKIDSKYQIYDRELNVLKNASYSDFVILMDRSKDFSLYKKIFEYMNIPLCVLRDEKINDEVILIVLKNIIKSIVKIKNNIFDEEFKHSFISILRSFLCEYNDEKIFDIFSSKSYFEDEIFNKLKEISRRIDYLSISNLIELVIDEFNVYEALIKIGNIENNMIILEYISETSKKLSNAGFNIEDFIKYLDDIEEKEYDIKFSSTTEDNNSVKIMTIHKSKGLEYSICYYSGLYNKFNISDLKERFMFDNSYGIITPYFKEGIGETVYKNLIKDNYIMEEISEKIRLLYVALTRAKEKMIILSDLSSESLDGHDSNGVLENNIRLGYRCFNDIFVSIKKYITAYITKINIEDYKMTKDYEKSGLFKLDLEETDEKLHVDEINIENELLEENTFSKHTNTLLSKEILDSIEYGLKMHYILETEDFNSSENEQVKKFLKVYKICGNPKVFKEYEFMFEEENKLYHGIIDLMFEYENYIDIVDYKLKNIDDENYLKQLTGYKNYIENKTRKNVNIYLYSILNGDLKKL